MDDTQRPQKANTRANKMMTEEERQKIILELEQEVLEDRPPYDVKLHKRLKQNKNKKCEVCNGELINGDCPEHAIHIRMHHNSLSRIRQQYEK